MVSLESSKLFSQLPVPELQKLRDHTRELRFRIGQDIFKEGDPGDGAYLVCSGAVEISAASPTGDQRVVFSRVLPGDVFGEMSLVDQNPRSASATAALDTAVCFVPREPLVALLRRTPELSLTLVQEISARLRVNNQKYMDKVLQAERMALVGRFASSIVHDLKNPLAIISFAAELACSDDASTEAHKTARERIMKQVDRINGLVNDILEFTRGTGMVPTFSDADYGGFVRTLVDDLQREIMHKHVTIECRNAPPSIVLALNPPRLTRVFYNLIGNAVDAMPDGGTVSLRFDLTDEEITTEITDTGKGIPPQIMKHLFEAFATYGKARGTGLGLSICQRIVTEHGGRITARNVSGGGAVFTFTLPRKRASATSDT
jgi:signal transduction histidine kinase